jgi:hypothetical protein
MKRRRAARVHICEWPSLVVHTRLVVYPAGLLLVRWIVVTAGVNRHGPRDLVEQRNRKVGGRRVRQDAVRQPVLLPCSNRLSTSNGAVVNPSLRRSLAITDGTK